MASTSETGHAVNLNNYNLLITRITGYGVRYNPTNNLIKIPAMQTVSNAAASSLVTLTTVKPAWDNAINNRQQLFTAMEKLCTRIINAYDSTEAVTDQQVKDAKVILRKIRGERKSKKITNPGPDDPAQISVSQQSYANQILHFAQLIGMVTAEPTYIPNETELQIASLTTFSDSLSTAMDSVATAQQPYLNALVARNTAFYAPKTGLVDRALEAKKYTKSVNTITLPEYRQISGLKFRKPPKTN